MKVLFAVHDEKVSLSIVKKYQKEYKEIISYKNVYYFNAILKELQRDNSYDRIIIDEELEEFTSTSYEEKDKFIFNKLDGITDEASNTNGNDIPIILICSDRRAKSEEILVKLFGIGIYNAIIGNDRSTDEVCRLIYSPRIKKDAKAYYRIDAKEVEYDPEKENDVSEEEMQHILSYFKKLGKNEEKYVEAFRRIVAQYNIEQLKIIASILPKNVKIVLEEESQEYQKLMNIKAPRGTRNSQKEKITSERLLNTSERKNEKQIIVPSNNKKVVKKVSIKKPSVEKAYIEEENNEIEDFQPIPERTVEKTRQPKKIFEDESEELIESNIEKPREESKTKPTKKEESSKQNDFNSILPGIEEENQFERIDDSLLRPIDEDEDDFEDDFEFEPTYEDDFEEEYDRDISNRFNDIKNKVPKKNIQPKEEPIQGLSDEDEFELINRKKEEQNIYKENIDIEEKNNFEEDEFEQFNRKSVQDFPSFNDSKSSHKAIQNYDDYDNFDYTNYNSLLSSNRKVIAFVGTSKNGTSFIVNNIAKILSDSGIDTAILDATQNKNSYYIYNKNDDTLRTDAANSIRNLKEGIAGGMKVSKNLSVYVEVPNSDDSDLYNAGPILENLIKNHSAVLIDCDFNTPLEYFANAQEIYLVQSMDVLTIQPLTAFLKELKNRDILEQNKLRIIINKTVRLRGIAARQIVGGMSNYNNPEMSIMTELFDRNAIVPIEIPFDVEAYAKYLEGLAECEITTYKYPKEFQSILKKLAAVIYPLLPSGEGKGQAKYATGYQYTNGFSNSVNNTLNTMKKNY